MVILLSNYFFYRKLTTENFFTSKSADTTEPNLKGRQDRVRQEFNKGRTGYTKFNICTRKVFI